MDDNTSVYPNDQYFAADESALGPGVIGLHHIKLGTCFLWPLALQDKWTVQAQ